MKWVAYNLLFLLVYPFLLPGFLLRMLRRGGYAKRFGDRFALYPKDLFGANRGIFDRHAPVTKHQTPVTKHQAPGTSFVWIHAVSVGEVQVAGQLMREWRRAEPEVRFCFSTTSSTGWKMAEREVTERDVLIYNPLDFPNFVKSALYTVRPRAIILTESEIWPNFILRAKKLGIPLFLINARVSDRSAPRYKLAKFFFGDVFRSFTRIFAQSELDKARLVAAGAPADRTDVTGSFKFDVAHRNEAKEKELREWIRGRMKNEELRMKNEELGVKNEELGAKNGCRILLGGSTWPGEDEVLLKIYKKLLDGRANNSLVLVIAPRHFEKADAVEANIRAAGFACIRRSRGDEPRSAGGRETEDGRREVFLADTTGELMGLYGIADVVFVGKSLCAHGSQNMIEPCLCGKPTFVGPYTENFRPVMSDLLEGEGIVQVKDAAELEEKVVEAFATLEGRGADASPLKGLGARAAAAVERRCGVVPRCVTAIREAIR